MQDIIRIPKDRIAVVIGKNGAVRHVLSERTGVSVNVDSKTGEVTLEAKDENAIHFFAVQNIVKAIARGFSPEHANTLLDDDFYLDMIDITDYTGKSEKEMNTKKGRIIGLHGETRKRLEESTNCFISVYGKTVSLIGKPSDMEICRKAIEMILLGARHTSVYKYLGRKSGEETASELGL